ncbi:hypothetical protein FBQ97_10660 [Acidobacteria bacterium ACD]|nr:MAG: hypothetical protein EDX89_07575 [Acidobacteriota bacterium]MCE7957111.1 hypothetical protein [Acidobacteria bacterium ACB2]MDL1950261.1 hypothetical protein [Acidobacteria bacterium ACD]
MRQRTLLAPFLLASLALALPAGAADPRGRFSAEASITTSQGTRRLAFDIVVDRPYTLEQALPLKKTLEEGGTPALEAALSRMHAGRLKVGNLERGLQLVLAEETSRGIRYVVVASRAIGTDELARGLDSVDYPFLVADFEVPEFGTGDGKIYPKASLSIGGDGRVQVDQYGGAEGELTHVKRYRP